jgi:hypothetical protein
MKKRHSAEQIVGMLRQADVALGKGQVIDYRLKAARVADLRGKERC